MEWKIGLITGGNRGIGYAIAQAQAARIINYSNRIFFNHILLALSLPESVST